MKLPDYLLWNRSHRGEALVDLIVGTASLGIIMVALFGAVLGILGQSSNITKRIQANWVANSYMEQITHFPFTDPDDSDTGSDMDDVDDFNDYSVVNYGLTVTVNVNDAEVNEGIISFSDSPLDNPDFKQVRVTISDGGLSEPIELKTLVPLDALPPPYITRIYTDYNADEPPPRYSEQEEDLNIMLVFDREVSVSDLGNITLTLNNVTETVTYGTDGIEGDMWYHNNLFNALLDDPGLLAGYGDDLVSKVAEGQDPIIATGSSISGDNLELTFTYDLGPDTKYHTSLSFDDYLDVERINLNGGTIQGLVNDNPDGVHAVEDDEGLIVLPIEDDLMLTNDEVIILNQHGTFYIFYEERDDGIDGWEKLQAVVNPEEVEEVELPTLGAIFDEWKRFSGLETFDNAEEATGNAAAWEAIWALDQFGSRLLDKNGEDSLDSFTMPLNVDPASGFVSELEYENFILETTLQSPDHDNDMIGVILAYEEGTDECSMKDVPDHDPETCGNKPGAVENPYVIVAARTGSGVNPIAGWGLIYARPDQFVYGTAGLVLADASCCDHCGSIINTSGVQNNIGNSNAWTGKWTRVKIEREKNILTARTTDWLPNNDASRANALTAPYLPNEGEEAVVEFPEVAEAVELTDVQQLAIDLDAELNFAIYNNGNSDWTYGHDGKFMTGGTGPGYGGYWYIRPDGALWSGVYYRSNPNYYAHEFYRQLSSAYHDNINLLTLASENAAGGFVTPYQKVCDEPVMMVDLTSDSRLHKFIGGKRDGGSSYGLITFSQPLARYYDIRMPPPAAAERNVDYVIYFHDRVDTDDDGNYDTWAPFDLTIANATGDNGRTLCYGLPTCSHPPPHEHNAKDLRRSGIWKWDETQDPARWVFRENALDELLGRTVQEATGHYRIISPDAEMFDGGHMFTDILESPAPGSVDDTYLIRGKFEIAEDYCDETDGVWNPVTNECSN